MEKLRKYLLSDETVEALVKLGEVLRPIHDRLVKEEKIKVVDGKIIDCETGEPIDCDY
jgi:hypothetical protein